MSTFLTRITDSPFVLEVSSTLGIKTIDELIEKIKKNPGKYTIGASGVGAMNHIAAESWMKQSNLDALLVQYQGGAQIRTAILSGDIDMTFATLNETLPLKQDNKVEFLATTATERLTDYPKVPTIKEAMNYDNFEAVFWTALLAPKGMNQEHVKKISAAMQNISKDKELREKLEIQGVTLSITDAQTTIDRMRSTEDAFAPILEPLAK